MTIIVPLACFSTLLLLSINFIRRLPKILKRLEKVNFPRLDGTSITKNRHETAVVLSELVEKDGAGSWPPNVDHDNWPKALQPYKDIYLELIPLLSSAAPSLDDDVNNERRDRYRSLMRKLLAERINISEVQQIMAAVEAGDWTALPRDTYNGFYCCVAVSRHAYRWAMIPVVKVAQYEKVVEFPPELDAPWPYLQRNFGVTADSGNNQSNVVHNFRANGERVYKINVNMNETIRSSEDVFFKMFYDLEVLAYPIYTFMVEATTAFSHNQKSLCLKHLQSITHDLRHLLKIFYENLHGSRIKHSVWLSYVQGFQGWGIGRMVDGEFVKWDGLSGNHVLFFQALDAFLGLDPYLTQANMLRYIPINQRKLCSAFRKHCFRERLGDGEEDGRIAEETIKIVNHVKVFRAAHRGRVFWYLQQPAPERVPMTAGKSVLVSETVTDNESALKPLDEMLAKRLRETV